MSHHDGYEDLDLNDPDFESKLQAFADAAMDKKLARDDEKWKLWRQGKLPVSGKHVKARVFSTL